LTRPLNAAQLELLGQLHRGWPWGSDGRTERSMIKRGLVVRRPHVMRGLHREADEQIKLPALTDAGAALALEIFGPAPPPLTNHPTRPDEEFPMPSPSSPPAFAFPAGDRLLNRRDVELEVRLSKATIYRRVGDGSFPPPIEYGPQCRRWPTSWVEAWKAHGAGWRSALLETARN
jgi:prophage regulatory protein